MKRLFKKFEDMMVAITFAESGEYDKANKYLPEELMHEQEEEGAWLQALQTTRNKSVY